VEVCCGVLRWPPAEFWQSTLAEIAAAVDGYIEAHSADDDVMTRDDLEAMKRQYPDTIDG
jgi:hypothetical protein